MALNITYPTSVGLEMSSLIVLGWSNTYGDSYFTVSRQINNNTTWQGTSFSIDSDLTRYSEQAEATWERVRYQVSGLPSGTISTTDWITVEGGTDPGGTGGGDPDPYPILSVPIIFTPDSVTPDISFNIIWTDTNGTTAEYDIEESVNGDAYQRIASNWSSKSYSRTPSLAWDVVKYRVRAIRNVETTAWGYSANIFVGTILPTIFPKMSVKVGDEVRTATDGWVMVNGTLRKITDIWAMVNGTLRKS